MDGAVVIPVSARNIEQHLHLGPAGVDPLADDVGVNLPVVGEEAGQLGGGRGGEGPRRGLQ